MGMLKHRVFSSFRSLGDEMILLIRPLLGAILETFSLPKCIQIPASICKTIPDQFLRPCLGVFGKRIPVD